MSKQYPILLYPDKENSLLFKIIDGEFDVCHCQTGPELIEQADKEAYKLLIISSRTVDDQCADIIQQFIDRCCDPKPAIAIIATSEHLDDKLKAFDIGCDDYISHTANNEEIIARLLKLIYHQIANSQLVGQMEMAKQMAFNAMTASSDMGETIRFLVNTSQCCNLDELGALVFRTVKHYGLCCSLQIRTDSGVKNMDQTGLARDLESQLLSHLQNSGRFYDFGRRTIINYGISSILIKDMPIEDSDRYERIKDTFFYIMQGVDARARGIDIELTLQHDNLLMYKLLDRMRKVIQAAEQSYQNTTTEISHAVDKMSEQMEYTLPHLSLSQDQEETIEHQIELCVQETHRIFSRGLQVDEGFRKLLETMDALIAGGSVSSDTVRQLLNDLD